MDITLTDMIALPSLVLECDYNYNYYYYYHYYLYYCCYYYD